MARTPNTNSRRADTSAQAPAAASTTLTLARAADSTLARAAGPR
jgi:hypothetical protein